MKLLLIYPNHGYLNDITYYHFGVAVLTSAMREAGHQVELLILNNRFREEDFLSKLEGFDPDVVGMSVKTNQWGFAQRLVSLVKRHSRAFVILGGWHPTMDPEAVIAEPGVDALCRGEGEGALADLLAAVGAGEDVSRIPNLWVKRDGSVVRNGLRPLIRDLDTLPLFDRSLFDFDEGLNDGEMFELERHIALYREELWLMTGRGCPYQCSYCSAPGVNRIYGEGHPMRKRSPGWVIEEAKWNLARHPHIRFIQFMDEVFGVDRPWTSEFLRLYRREIGLPFGVMTRIETARRDLLAELREAGCNLALIGVESGNEWLREHVLNRTMTNDEIARVFDDCADLGIRTFSFTMVGFPYETREMVEETLALMRRIRPGGNQSSIFYPFPGTEIYRLCKEKGFLTDETATSFFDRSVLKLPDMTAEEIQVHHKRMLRLGYELQAERGKQGIVDLCAAIGGAEIRADREDFVGLSVLPGGPNQELFLIEHPNSEVTYRLQVPAHSELRFGIGLHPITYSCPGSGVRFEVDVNGERIFSRLLDPKGEERDRGWFPAAVSLEPYGGKEVDLTLRARTGPRGDSANCTGGWVRPHVAAVDRADARPSGAPAVSPSWARAWAPSWVPAGCLALHPLPSGG